jgi:hypothetical protein
MCRNKRFSGKLGIEDGFPDHSAFSRARNERLPRGMSPRNANGSKVPRALVENDHYRRKRTRSDLFRSSLLFTGYSEPAKRRPAKVG